MGNNPAGCKVLICNLSLLDLIAQNIPGTEKVLAPYINDQNCLYEISGNLTITYFLLFDPGNVGGGGHPCNATCARPPNLQEMIEYYTPLTESVLMPEKAKISNMTGAVYASTSRFVELLLSVVV